MKEANMIDGFHPGYADMTPEERLADAYVEAVEMPESPFRKALLCVLRSLGTDAKVSESDWMQVEDWLRYRRLTSQ